MTCDTFSNFPPEINYNVSSAGVKNTNSPKLRNLGTEGYVMT